LNKQFQKLWNQTGAVYPGKSSGKNIGDEGVSKEAITYD